MDKKPEPLALHYKIMDYIDELKGKTPVTISDLEKYYAFLLQFDESVTSLLKSRAKWRIRAEKAEKELKDGKN